MRAGRNPISMETEIYLNEEETAALKEMVRGANLPLRRKFNEIMKL